MKRLFVFCDGTGQDGMITPDGPTGLKHAQFEAVFEDAMTKTLQANAGIPTDPDGGTADKKYATNVLRLSRAVPSWTKATKEQIQKPQLVFYQSGVGSEADFKGEDPNNSNMILQALGTAVATKIRDAYAFLCQNYDNNEDELFLFGFSRGAYIVRKLSELIDEIGLLQTEDLGSFFKIWRDLVDGKTPQIPSTTRRARIRCVGVWDTVGSVFNSIDILHMSDTAIPSTIDVALHALSVHENRKKFFPTLWSVPKKGLAKGQVLKQVWFPGDHRGVGGSYERHELADIALYWMIGEILEHKLFELDTDFIWKSKQTNPDNWGASQPHNVYMEAPSSTKLASEGGKTRLEGRFIRADSVFHQSWKESPNALNQSKDMLTPQILQAAFGSKWKPLYAELNGYEKDCKTRWKEVSSIPAVVFDDVSVISDPNPASWTASGDIVPDNASKTVLAARGEYEGNMYPGERSTSGDQVVICWKEKVVKVAPYEALMGKSTSVRWIRTRAPFSLNSLGGLHPVPAGKEDGAVLYSCQCFHQGALYYGKVRANAGNGRFPFEGRELGTDTFNVLVWNPRFWSFRHEAGQFDTHANSRVVIPFEYSSPTPPLMIVSLNYLTGPTNYLRAYIAPRDATTSSFTGEFFGSLIPGQHGEEVRHGGGSWLKLAAGDPAFHCGVVICPGEVYALRQDFDSIFEDARVFVCPTDITIADEWHIDVSTGSTGPSYFDLNVKTWGRAVLKDLKVSWVVYSAANKGVSQGVFECFTETAGTVYGQTSFGRTFARPPKVFTALQMFDLDSSKPLRINVHTFDVTTTGMSWSFGTWGNGKINKARAAYLALLTDD